tara:strand:- start:1636 stop:1926 length:291 start_codon:yes stop_codon:yes gene_type:complete
MFNFLTGAFLIASIGLCIWFPSVIYYSTIIANLCFTLVGLINGLLLYHAFGYDYFDEDSEDSEKFIKGIRIETKDKTFDENSEQMEMFRKGETYDN